MTGRPRTFDREKAVLIAMEQFWRDGYDETTIATLTQAMGTSPPSLYAAFGDKDRLFEAAAACYFDHVSAQTDIALSRTTAREALVEILLLAATAHTDEGTPPGCFMVSEPRLSRQRGILRDRIKARVQQGLAEGDLPEGTDPTQVAEYVLAIVAGMSARARDGGRLDEVMAIATLAIVALPSEATSAH